jgi:hypothetical protein
MPEQFPHFDSDDEMKEWFETANLSEYALDRALELVVASHVELSVGDEPASPGSTTAGQTGTLRDPVRLVSG